MNNKDKNKEQKIAQEDTAPKLTAGKILKQQREKKGLSQQEVADRLRLRISIIENLEKDIDNSALEHTYTKGYLKSYARFIDLDEDLVLAAFNCEHAGQNTSPKMKSFSRKTKKQQHDKRIMLITWGVFVLVVCISSIWWWQNQSDPIDELSSPPALTQTVAADGEALTPRTDNAAPEAQALTKQGPDLKLDAPNAPVDTQLAAEPTKVAKSDQKPVAANLPSSAPTSASSASDETVPAKVDNIITEQGMPLSDAAKNLLKMTFSEDCWLQVKNADNKIVYSGVKKGGEQLELEGSESFNIVLGVPKSVTMTFKGEPVDLTRYTKSGRVARLTLK